MIELAVLGLLHAHDRHGYDLRKRMAELGEGNGVSYGSLYPALSRLERNGFVRAVTPGRAATAGLGGPMTGAITGELAALRHRKATRAAAPPAGADAPEGRRADKRNRKVYRITDRGRQRFDELLRSADPGDERAFALQVAFCRHLRPAERLDLFGRRRVALTDQLADVTRRSGDTAADPYLRSLREHDTQTITNHLAWLDELVELTTSEANASEVATHTGGTTS
jgi:DNA-binding PadR family transcriptional regulator